MAWSHKKGRRSVSGTMISFESDYTTGAHPAILEKLKNLFSENGIPFSMDSPTNQQFVILENEQMRRLSENVAFSFWERYDETHTVVRFATSWSTTEADLEALRAAL